MAPPPGEVQGKELEVCTQAPKILRVCRCIIDRHYKGGGYSNLHFDERRLARPPLFCLFT
jgi:hypothetical protein